MILFCTGKPNLTSTVVFLWYFNPDIPEILPYNHHNHNSCQCNQLAVINTLPLQAKRQLLFEDETPPQSSESVAAANPLTESKSLDRGPSTILETHGTPSKHHRPSELDQD
uniref:Uncharacterized protein n=1 Tax=Populus trichocarpa TaxID=3694 RepID=A0A3N7G309_POPTR